MNAIISVQYTSSCENNFFINWLLNIERHRWLIASRHLSRKNAHSCGMIEPNHLPSEVMRKNSLFKELTFRHDYWPKKDDSVGPLHLDRSLDGWIVAITEKRIFLASQLYLTGMFWNCTTVPNNFLFNLTEKWDRSRFKKTCIAYFMLNFKILTDIGRCEDAKL